MVASFNCWISREYLLSDLIAALHRVSAGGEGGQYRHAVYSFFNSIVRFVGLPAVTVTVCSFGPVTDWTATSL